MKSIYNKKKYSIKKYSIKKPKKLRNPKKAKKAKKAKKTKKLRSCKKKYCQKGCGYKKQNGGYGIHTEMNKISDYAISFKDEFLGKQYD